VGSEEPQSDVRIKPPSLREVAAARLTEGVLPLGEGGEAETLFRLDGWGSTHSNFPHLASPFGRGVLRKQDGEGVLPF